VDRIDLRQADELLDRKTVQSWLMGEGQRPPKLRVVLRLPERTARSSAASSILNESKKDFATGLIIDSVAFDGGGRVVPEPAVIVLLALVFVAKLMRWTAIRLTSRATARRPVRSNGRIG
jgi:hypothetical protein